MNENGLPPTTVVECTDAHSSRAANASRTAVTSEYPASSFGSRASSPVQSSASRVRFAPGAAAGEEDAGDGVV
jgi:hypothetical protein